MAKRTNDKIGESLGLPKLGDALRQMRDQDNPEKEENDENNISTEEIIHHFQVAEQTQNEIAQAGNLLELDDHGKSMDKIADKAMEWAKDIIDDGFNAPHNQRGKIFEAGYQMLTTAMQAKDSKADKKLKGMRLRLDIARLDRDNKKMEQSGIVYEGNGKFVADRNELIKQIHEESRKQNDDKS